MDDIPRNIALALGLETVTKIVTRTDKKLDLSQCLKGRYHHKLTLQAIADKYGASKQAVMERINKFEALLGDRNELASFKDLEADIQSAIKKRYSSELLTVDLSKTSPKDLAMVYGITYDKNRLQTGQSTSNQSVFFSVVSESDEANTPKIIDVTPLPE